MMETKQSLKVALKRNEVIALLREKPSGNSNWLPLVPNAALTGAEGVRVEGTVMQQED